MTNTVVTALPAKKQSAFSLYLNACDNISLLTEEVTPELSDTVRGPFLS